jgi:hypothetical protein
MLRDSSTEKPANRSTSSPPPTHIATLSSAFAEIEVFQSFRKKGSCPDLLNTT